MVNRLSNITLDDSGKWYTLTIHEGQIERLEEQNTLYTFDFDDWNHDKTHLNGQGRVLLPGLTEAHAHIDKNYSPISNVLGTLPGAIEAMGRYKAVRDLNTVIDNADQAVRSAIKHGVTRFRSHIDLSSEEDLILVERLRDLKARYLNSLHIEYTALGETQSHRGCELMQKAIDLGIDFIGGAPALCSNPSEAINNAIELALLNQLGLDLHIDETESIQSNTLEYLADQCLEKKFSLPVFASHCCSLGFRDLSDQTRIAKKLFSAGVQVITLPSSNLVLMGRGLQPTPRGIPPILCLLENQVRVHVGSDNVQDPFNPFGNYDPLTAAHLLAHTAQLTTPDQLHTCLAMSYQWQSKDTPFKVGDEASFALLDTTHFLDAVCAPPLRLATIFKGHCIYRAHLTETWREERWKS